MCLEDEKAALGERRHGRAKRRCVHGEKVLRLVASNSKVARWWRVAIWCEEHGDER